MLYIFTQKPKSVWRIVSIYRQRTFPFMKKSPRSNSCSNHWYGVIFFVNLLRMSSIWNAYLWLCLIVSETGARDDRSTAYPCFSVGVLLIWDRTDSIWDKESSISFASLSLWRIMNLLFVWDGLVLAAPSMNSRTDSYFHWNKRWRSKKTRQQPSSRTNWLDYVKSQFR